MSPLLDKLLTRAQLRNPLVLRDAKAEFVSRLQAAEIVVRMQIEAGKVVSADAWQDVADAIYIAGKTVERINGSDDPDVRVMAGGYRAVYEATARPGYRATPIQLMTIAAAIDRARDIICAADDLGPFREALELVLNAHAQARHVNA